MCTYFNASYLSPLVFYFHVNPSPAQRQTKTMKINTHISEDMSTCLVMMYPTTSLFILY